MLSAPIEQTAPTKQPAPRRVGALGNFRRDQRAGLLVSAEDAGFELDAFGSVAETVGWLDGVRPDALLVDTTVQDAESLCIEARSQARLARVPILVLAREVSDLSFAEAYGWGADDVLPLGAVRPLVARLRALPKGDSCAPHEARGIAVVANPDRSTRVVLGRVLRNAGFDVRFAVDKDDAWEQSTGGSVELVVASSELDEPATLVKQARIRESSATWIVTCRPRDLGKHRRSLDSMSNATVTDGYAPPENVLFLSNELARQRGTDNRASARLLYGTTVGFRGAGRDTDEHGFTYNVSRGGLYVRTLNPPKDDDVWVELVPPRSERRVRLVGRVAWRRPLGPNGNATVPAGFGVQIVDGAASDLDAWREGYKRFGAALG